MQGATDIPEPDYPYPVRYWWLRRIGVLAAILAVLLIITRFAWGWDAKRRLRAEIDAARSRGEPVLPEDFRSKELPDAENYVVALNNALSVLKTNVDSPSASAMEFENYPPYSAEWHAMARSAIAAQSAALTAIQAARPLHKYNWRMVPSHLMVDPPSGRSWTESRHLVNLLGDTAVFQHLNGDDAAALDSIVDMLKLGESHRSSPSLIGFLVGSGIDAVATDRLQMISAGLHPQPDILVRERMKRLITQLLSETSSTGVISALHAERAITLDAVSSVTAKLFLLRPMYDLDFVRCATITRKVMRSVDTPELRLDPGIRTAMWARGPIANGKYDRLFSYAADSLYRVATTAGRITFDRRVAAVSLAVQLYRIDHDNRWPMTLEELVPAYLPAVPIDSISPSRPPLIYLIRDNGTRPMIYSRSADDKDQRAEMAPPATPCYGWITLDKIDDQYRDLSRFAPPPAATQRK